MLLDYVHGTRPKTCHNTPPGGLVKVADTVPARAGRFPLLRRKVAKIPGKMHALRIMILWPYSDVLLFQTLMILSLIMMITRKSK